MSNSVLQTAIISKLISKPLASTSEKKLSDIEGDIAKRVVNYRLSLNLDRRNVAIAGTQSIWIWDQYMNMEPEWQAVVESSYIEHEHVLMLKKPQSILAFDSYASGLAEYKSMYPDTEITFMNNDVLAEFEQHVRDYEPGYDYDYSVIDFSDLGTEKFDLIQGFGWNFMHSPETVLGCVESLNPGGALLISLSNNSAKLYTRANYHAHPYVDIHRLLEKCDGFLYHVASGYGTTTFIKN
ncbi:MAG: hypothetical protein EBY38_06240 [Flavobacteriaceae bacterium]|jgi:hypothetical protein|nr:hypothetical protein [Flavobacteriaceae bacterium]